MGGDGGEGSGSVAFVGVCGMLVGRVAGGGGWVLCMRFLGLVYWALLGLYGVCVEW